MGMRSEMRFMVTVDVSWEGKVRVAEAVDEGWILFVSSPSE